MRMVRGTVDSVDIGPLRRLDLHSKEAECQLKSASLANNESVDFVLLLLCCAPAPDHCELAWSAERRVTNSAFKPPVLRPRRLHSSRSASRV